MPLAALDPAIQLAQDDDRYIQLTCQCLEITGNCRDLLLTGFDPTGKPYQDIKFQVLRVFKNLILAKKNIQAVLTITANGGRDFQGLTNQYSEGQILSHMEESVLKRYKRTFYPGGTMTD